MDYDEKMWSVKSIKGKGINEKVYITFGGKIIFSQIYSVLSAFQKVLKNFTIRQVHNHPIRQLIFPKGCVMGV